MNDLIDTKDIAQMLGVTRAHCVGRIVKRPDFPKPAVALSQRLKRWRKVEVMKWMGIK
jgi:predicted DNA-binding transcriptional regulator AlpA